jgi:hypothetical protein
MGKKFEKLPRLVQLILLLIPVVNWVIEILVRGSNLIHNLTLGNIIGLILVIIFGLPLGWIDFIWVLLFKHLIWSKA